MSDWISVEEAAMLSGYHPEHIRRLIREGYISADRKGPMYWVRRDSVVAYVSKADKKGEKRGPKTK